MKQIGQTILALSVLGLQKSHSTELQKGEKEIQAVGVMTQSLNEADLITYDLENEGLWIQDSEWVGFRKENGQSLSSFEYVNKMKTIFSNIELQNQLKNKMSADGFEKFSAGNRTLQSMSFTN